MEPLRHISNPLFSTVIFRRTYPQISNEGGLWDTSCEIYPIARGYPRQSDFEWRFPSKSTVRFCHMQLEQDRFQWDGSQIPLICFDQVEHLTDRQFWYMFSRNRSACGVRPYIRMTANPPHPDHWLRRFIDWWIDPDTGLAIEERSSVLRWFVRIEDEIKWADSREELLSEYGLEVRPKSFTFIRGKLDENEILLRKDPSYRANLMAMQKIDRERLLYGNWNVRESAGSFFNRNWFEICPAAPAMTDIVRYWDRAATAAQNADPRGSWTVGVKMGRDRQCGYWVLDVIRFQGSPATVQAAIKNTASQDGDRVRVGIEQDPGQAGKVEAQLQVTNLAGYDARVNAVHEAKGVRARGLSAQAEVGNVKLIRGAWNEAYIGELENFDGSQGCLADQVDASSGAFLMLTSGANVGVLRRSS
jgi:predicted phage terminase large subunit-like protein